MMRAAVYDRGLLSDKAAERLPCCGMQLQAAGLFRMPGEPDEPERAMRFAQLQDRIAAGLVDALIVPDLSKQVNRVLPELCALGDIPVYYAGMQQIRSAGRFDLKPVSRRKPWLDVLEFHVADTCNLNCKGCGHCANLIQEPGFPDMAGYEQSLRRLAELFDGIGLIRLLGGEPLLNPALSDFLRMTRQYFPHTDLRIVTNGILLHDMPEQLKCVLRETCVTVDISLYPPMHHRLDAIRSEMEAQGLLYTVYRVDRFYRRFTPEGGNDPADSFRHCDSAENHLMYKGKLASCAMPFSIDVLNEKYGYGITHDAWIDLFDRTLDGYEINRRLAACTSLCAYCSSGIEEFRWEQRPPADAEASDWIYQE